MVLCLTLIMLLTFAHALPKGDDTNGWWSTTTTPQPNPQPQPQTQPYSESQPKTGSRFLCGDEPGTFCGFVSS